MKILWRIAAALCLAHVVLMLAGFSQQHAPRFGDGSRSVVATYLTGAAARTYAGEYVALLGFLVLLAAVPLLSTLLRGEGPTSAWLCRLVSTAGTVYVAVTLGASFAPPAAAFYLARHGADAGTVAALDKLGSFGTGAAIAALGAFTVAIGAAVLVGAALPRWVGVTGVVVGVWVLVSVAGLGHDLIDQGMLVWMLWVAALAVAMLRRSGRPAAMASLAEPAVALS